MKINPVAFILCAMLGVATLYPLGIASLQIVKALLIALCIIAAAWGRYLKQNEAGK